MAADWKTGGGAFFPSPPPVMLTPFPSDEMKPASEVSCSRPPHPHPNNTMQQRLQFKELTCSGATSKGTRGDFCPPVSRCRVQQSDAGGLAAGNCCRLETRQILGSSRRTEARGFGDRPWHPVPAIPPRPWWDSFIAKTARPWGEGWTRRTELPRQRLTHRRRNFRWRGGGSMCPGALCQVHCQISGSGRVTTC